MHFQPAYADLSHLAGDFRAGELVAREWLNLPMYAELSDKEQSRIAKTLKQATANSTPLRF